MGESKVKFVDIDLVDSRVAEQFTQRVTWLRDFGVHKESSMIEPAYTSIVT
jgi:hypothetical protein